MTGLFHVVYFDPVTRALNMTSVDVLAPNAAIAIKLADKRKPVQKYRVQTVECLGFSDE